MTASDVDSPAQATVLSDTAPAVGVWTHLLATYDSSSHQLRLYVNGAAQAASATLSGGFNATGPVAIGRRLSAGTTTDYFTGVIDDLRIYGRVVGTGEKEFTDPLRPVAPTISFPNGSSGTVGLPMQVTFSAGGDTNVTGIKYSLDAQTMTSTVVLPTAGGQVTVSVTPATVGDVFLFAASVAAGRQSDTVRALTSVAPPSSLSGTVTSATTGLALGGIVVTLLPVGLTATTASNGTYTFNALTAGSFTVSAAKGEACGIFATTDVDVAGPTLMDLALAPQADQFGYTCTAEDHIAHATYLPADGTVLALTGDDAIQPVGLPFPMLFYGHVYTSAWLDTNGIMSFADPGRPHTSDRTSMPSADDPNAVLAPYWDDLIVDSSASVRTAVRGTAPNRTFVIEWRNVTFFDGPTLRVSFEILLSENGDIMFSYSGLDNDIERGSQAVVGIENQTGRPACSTPSVSQR
jgi:hypothetical protein